MNRFLFFLETIKDELSRVDIDDECRIIAGRDFNVILDLKLDGQGGRGGSPKLKESVKQIENICSIDVLIAICRVRNPSLKSFTWCQKTPVAQRRLDFWLVDNALQEDVDHTAIIPFIKSDHLAIISAIKSVESQTNVKDVTDPRLLWDLFKYKIRQNTISYSKETAKKKGKRKESDNVGAREKSTILSRSI